MSRRLFGVLVLVLAVALAGTWWSSSGPVSHVSRPPAPPEGPLPAWSGSITPRAPQPPSGMLDLVKLQPRIDLPPTNIPPAGAARAAYTFRDPEAAPLRDVYQMQLPFPIPAGTHRFAPEGMVVEVDGEPAEFSVNLRGQGSDPLWMLTAEASLRVRSPAPPKEVRVEHPALLQQIQELDPSIAPLDPTARAEWATRRILRAGMSREGLLLPAPATATWPALSVPTGARFVAYPALAPAPTTPRSDGVMFELIVIHNGVAHRAGSFELSPDDAMMTSWQVDLTPWAGETIDLKVQTDPRTNADHDYAFLGSPRVFHPAEDTPTRVVVIGLDTVRPDHLGLYGYARRPTSPEIDAWARSGAVVFDQAWTTAPRTRPAFRAATTGRLPLEAVCAPTIGSVFRRHGFITAGIVSNIHLNPRFGFDEGFDLWWLDHGADAEDQVDRALSWLDDHADQDSYLFLHIMDPHIFYVPPEPWRSRMTQDLPPLGPNEPLPDRFNRWQVYRWMNQGKLTPNMKAHIIARYDGELAWTSHQLGRFFERLKDLPGHTTVVLHSDHGEEFWDHGGFEHNHAMYDEVTKAVFVIQPPSGAGVEAARSPALASLEDIGPTLYEIAGLSDPPPSDGVSLVPALRGQPMDPDRPIAIAHRKYDAEQWAVVWRDHKYIVNTGSGSEQLFHLVEDPGEHVNLADHTDTTPWVQALAQAHKIDAGPGWRVDVTARPDTHFEISLPQPALTAGVLDPEAVTRKPVNKVWGERPPRTPADVGEVTLSEDRSVVRFRSGPHGQGVLYVLFKEASDPADARLHYPGDDTPRRPTRGVWAAQGLTLEVRPGAVVVPPPDEAARIRACELAQGEDDPTGDERALLEALGYVGGHEDDDP